jgi:ferredoxin like protein
MKQTSVEERLAVNKYSIDRDVHIRVDAEICRTCDMLYCVVACPAQCFKPTGEGVTFSFEGCLECGSCRIVCPKGAVDWTLPRAGFGISYQFG